jgi:catechol-2,3-dioxygenase
MPSNTRSRLSSALCTGSLAVATVVTLAARAPSAPAGVAPVRSINHLHIRVSDPRRSFEFYAKLLGAHIIDTSRGNWTVMLGDTGSWLSLGIVPPGSNMKPASLDHVGIGIDLPDKPDPLRQALEESFPSSKVRSPGKPGDLTYDRSIYLEDPDGVAIQLVSRRDDGHLPRPDATPAVTRARIDGAVRVRSINHLQLNATDIAKTEALYSKLLGATVRDKSASGRMMTMTLPGANSWLSFGTVDDREKAGKMDHIGIGIDWPQDVEGLRTALKKAFPEANVRSPGTATSPTYNRSIYLDDPDGLHVQLVSSTDDGKLPGGTAR